MYLPNNNIYTISTYTYIIYIPFRLCNFIQRYCKDWRSCTGTVSSTGTWSRRTYCAAVPSSWKSPILVWPGRLGRALRTPTTCPPDGIEPPRCYCIRSITARRSTCGPSAASWPSCTRSDRCFRARARSIKYSKYARF